MVTVMSESKENDLKSVLPFRGILLEKFLRSDLRDLQNQVRSILVSISRRNAIFKTKVQRGGRISIPEAERDSLGISEGDIVQVILYPVKREEKDYAVE